MSNYWVLKDKVPIPATLEEWGHFFESPNKFLWELSVGVARIVTIFNGKDFDHEMGYRDGPPLLFSTMIFGGAHGGQETFYETYDQALAGHCAAVELVEAENA